MGSCPSISDIVETIMPEINDMTSAIVESWMRLYICQAASVAHVAIVDSKDCSIFVNRAQASFVFASPNIAEYVSEEINKVAARKRSQRKRTWKSRLRKAVYEFMSHCYSEMDTKDAYVKSSYGRITCQEALNYEECLQAAARKIKSKVNQGSIVERFRWFKAA